MLVKGPERKSAVIEAKNRELVAYHEGGHALVALYTPGAMPIHKATIVPRGSALGMVCIRIQLPNLSVDKIIKCDHSDESYRAVYSGGAVYCAVQGGSKFKTCQWIKS